MSSPSARSLPEPTRLFQRAIRGLAPGQHAWLVPAIALAHVILAIYLSARLPVWIDEAYSLRTTSFDLPLTLHYVHTYDLQPPAWFVILWAFRRLLPFDPATPAQAAHPQLVVFCGRALSFFFSTAFVFLSAAAARRYWKGIHPAWFAAVAAFHPQTVYAATELRRYSMVLCLNAALIWLYHRAFLGEESAAENPGRKTPRRSAIGFSLAAALVLYTDYYSGFLLAAGAVPLAVLKRWRDLKHYVLAMIVTGLVFCPQLFFLPGQISGHEREPVALADFPVRLERLGKVYQDLFVPLFGGGWFNRAQKAMWLALGPFVVATLLFRTRKLKSPESVAPLILTALLMATFVGLLTIVPAEIMNHRHLGTLLVPAMLASGGLLLAWDKRLAIAGMSIVLVCEVISIPVKWGGMAKGGNLIRAAEYLHTHERSGQPILIYPPDLTVPFEYYYRGPNTLVSLPEPPSLEIYYPVSQPFRDRQQIYTAMGAEFEKADYVWLLGDEFFKNRHYTNIDFRVDILETFLEDNYELIEAVDLTTGIIRKYHKKPRPVLMAAH